MKGLNHRILVIACLVLALVLRGISVDTVVPQAGAGFISSKQAGTASIREAALDRECYVAGHTVAVFVEVDTTLTSQEVSVETKILDPDGVTCVVTSRTFTTYDDQDDSFVESLTLPTTTPVSTYAAQVIVYDAATMAQQDVWTQHFAVDPACGAVTPVVTEDVPRLLVVTSSARLTAEFGSNGWNQISAAIDALQGTVLDVSAGSFQEVDSEIERIGRDNISMILIVGGHDVVPFSILDNPTQDDDTLYTDDVYADFDHDPDTIIDVPITRIPDGKDLDLVLTQLSGTALPPSGGFALANVKRPAAEAVADIFGAPTLWSTPTLHTDIAQSAVTVRHDYFMLHGSKDETHTWWGEGTAPKYPEAFKVSLANSQGIVLSGCCYGAYVLDKNPDNSIALRFLKNGVRSFIGCTGIHYSVLGKEPNGNGQLFHKMFWTKVVAGKAPLQAFYETKREYLPQTGMRPVHRKLVHEFVYFGSPGAQPSIQPQPPLAPPPAEPWQTRLGQKCIEEWQDMVIAGLNRTRSELAPWRISPWGHFLGTNATAAQPENWGNRWRWVWKTYTAKFSIGGEMAWGPGTGIPTQGEYVYRCMGISPP